MCCVYLLTGGQDVTRSHRAGLAGVASVGVVGRVGGGGGGGGGRGKQEEEEESRRFELSGGFLGRCPNQKKKIHGSGGGGGGSRGNPGAYYSFHAADTRRPAQTHGGVSRSHRKHGNRHAGGR